MSAREHKSAGQTAGNPADGQPEEGEPPERDGPLVIDVVIDEADWSAFGDVEAAVMAAAQAVGTHAELGIERAEATVALSSDAEVAALNGTFRGKPTPTNVLSFPAGPQGPGPALTNAPRMLGDIIVARETLLREAAGQGISPSHHLKHLVVHGLLHLLGYDHETEDEASVMETLETSILAGLGIADPYAELEHPAREA